MAFDQLTRGRLQRFVNDGREVLKEEFIRQLQIDYGLDPTSGTITPMENLRHLNDSQRETARILRETLDHYCAGHDTDTKQGLDRIVREQAFTVLNRLAALRMAEARGLMIESVGSGYQAKGFQLYARLANTGLGETGDAYAVYLQSVFDELAHDLPSLFDRFSPQGRLFPREGALLQVLGLINHGEIEPLWGEDETIGWIYQYFNSKEERKAMREASQSPRDSRDLAVRNQFFTPRYVVEFLVDNTLGRLWFDLTGGQTALRDRCKYLLVKPVKEPDPAKCLRDPRTIKLLDPACGSMHFGLYAFDLFQEIYREAWEWEETHGPGSLIAETSGSPHYTPLRHTYGNQKMFMHDVPRLIIEHNIFGVDIDPRAAQIASLALWLRAQRAWHQAGARPKDRPQIGRGHVVAAVAPPAEVGVRRRFMEALGPLDAELFEQTLFKLKGLPELGVLLKLEKEIPVLIRKVFGEHGDLFRTEDTTQWKKAEARLWKALTDYAWGSHASYQSRLFADDALQGLRIVDMMQIDFDVVVMNPPFGQPTTSTREYIEGEYWGSHGDIYTTFVKRAVQLAPRGYVGCITSSSFLLYPRLEDFRRDVLQNLFCVVDFGLGVMDEAMVRAAAYVLSPQIESEFLGANAKGYVDKLNAGATPASFIELFELMNKQSFADLPQGRLLIDAPPSVREILAKGPYLEPVGGTAREGMKTFDNERFIRLPWEVSSEDIGNDNTWRWLTKGGEFSYFYAEVHLVLNWAQDGAELREVNISVNGSTSQVRQASTYWGLPGATYSKRASSFSARILPEGCIFTSMGPAVLPLNEVDPLYLLGWLNSSLIRALTHLNAGAFDNYTTGALKRLPWKAPSSDQSSRLASSVAAAVLAARRSAAATNECSRWFIGLPISNELSGIHKEINALIQEHESAESLALRTADTVVSEVYTLADLDWTVPFLKDTEVSTESAIADGGYDRGISLSIVARLLVSYAFGIAFGRWAATPKGSPGITNEELSPLATPPSIPPGACLVRDCGRTLSIMTTDNGPVVGLGERIRQILANLSSNGDRLHDDIVYQLGVDSLEKYIDAPNLFFAAHLSQYTDSKRQAPIYWPLSTASGRYTLWIYYPNLNSQTLYSAVNDFIEPKLKHVGSDAGVLRDKGSARSRIDERAFEALLSLEFELIELRDALLKIAPTYHPRHDDGVQITAAPLWEFFRHKSWQKVLRDTWVRLEKGEYDWSHLAMSLWPDRVREKCKVDRSLAIAHDLDHLYVKADLVLKTRGKTMADSDE